MRAPGIVCGSVTIRADLCIVIGDLLRDRLLVQLHVTQIDGGNITPIRMIVSPN